MNTENDDYQMNMALAKDLADAVSTQARVANRAWLVLMVVAMFVLIPRPNSTAYPDVELPFNLGKVDPGHFFQITFWLLVVLTTSFCVAHAQQVRATMLAHRALNKLEQKPLGPAGIHLRDLFDTFRLPSINRVAPLAQLLRGKYQFFTEKQECPAWLRFLSGVYYLILKFVATIVYLVLPSVALWKAYMRAIVEGGIASLVTVGAIVAGLALLQVLLSDLRYMLQTAGVIWRAGS